MKRIALFAAVALAAIASPVRSQAQTGTEAEVRAVIDRLFDAMRRGDGTALAAQFHPAARLQSVGVSRQTGQPELETDSIEAFARAVGSPHPGMVWDERVSGVEIRVDGNFAQAWMNYTFYIVQGETERLSHCGVDAFQFFKGADGWKVIQITDTRRRENCPALPRGGR